MASLHHPLPASVAGARKTFRQTVENGQQGLELRDHLLDASSAGPMRLLSTPYLQVPIIKHRVLLIKGRISTSICTPSAFQHTIKIPHCQLGPSHARGGARLLGQRVPVPAPQSHPRRLPAHPWLWGGTNPNRSVSSRSGGETSARK